MLEIKKTAIGLDEKEALSFLKKSVYDKVERSQQGRLKCHLDIGGDPVEKFKKMQ